MNDQPAANTDRELWRKGGGDGNGMSYYEPSIHVTQDERIGINVGGYVFEMLVEEWHQLAAERFTLPVHSLIRSSYSPSSSTRGPQRDEQKASAQEARRMPDLRAATGRAGGHGETDAPKFPETKPWWAELDPFDALSHIIVCLENLLNGVEDDETLEECQAAAAVWTCDFQKIREAREQTPDEERAAPEGTAP